MQKCVYSKYRKIKCGQKVKRKKEGQKRNMKKESEGKTE